MKAWIPVVAAALLVVPAAAQDKDKKDDKKKDEKKAAAPVAKASPEELMKQAEAKSAAGDVEGAIDLLKQAAAADATGQATLRLGQALEGKFELDVAMDEYQSAAAKLQGPAKGEALGRLSVLQDTRGMAAEAAASAQAAAAADPEGVWPTIASSRQRAREGKADEAIALAQKAGASGGTAAAVALAYAQETQGDLAAAEATCRAALEKEPGSVAASIGLARVLRKTNRAEEALPLLQKAIEKAPGAIAAYKESALSKLALGRTQEALGDSSIAAAMAEKDPEAQALALEVKSAIALDAIRQGQVDLAIQDLTALRDQNPTSAAVRVGLAKAYVAKRQPDAALPELQKAVELDPKMAEAQYQLGYVQHVLKNNPAAAVPAYEKAVALDPGNVVYRTNLGAALVATKQIDRAVEELNKVTATPGYNKADAWIYLGQAYVSAKKYKEAIPPLEKAAQVAPNSDQAYAYLGWAYFGLKDADNFKKAAGKARTLGYKEPTLLQYLGRVEAGEAIK
jgi:tetratricopeptide (TPR) repeat protein